MRFLAILSAPISRLGRVAVDIEMAISVEIICLAMRWMGPLEHGHWLVIAPVIAMHKIGAALPAIPRVTVGSANFD